MPKYIGDKLLKARYVGTQAITKIYRGASLVWGAIKETLAQISGKSMTLVNCTREESLNDFKIFGKSEQTKYQGYQLINVLEVGRTATANGVTFTILEDGWVSAKGTASARATFNFAEFFTVPSGYYTLSAEFVGTKQSINTRVQITNVGSNPFYSVSNNGSQTLNSPIEFVVNQILVRIESGDVVDFKVRAMFEKGSTAHPYEPYVGGIPSPSPSYPQSIESVVEPVVKFSGLNKFEYEYFYNNYEMYGTSAVGRCPIKLKPNTKYRVASDFNAKSGNASVFAVGGYSITLTPSTLTNGIMPNLYRTVTSDENGYITIGIYVTGENAVSVDSFRSDTYHVQVEEGTIFTSFEPYQEPQSYTWNHTLYGIPVSSNGNYTDESGQQWIADYVDVENKKLWHCVTTDIRKDTVIAFQPNYSAGATRVSFPVYNGERYNNDGGRHIDMVLSTHFKPNSTNSVGACFVYQTSGERSFTQFFAYFPSDLISTRAELDVWLANNPDFGVMIKADVPYSEDLTDAEIEAFKQLKTFKPTTIVSNNYDAHMSTSYHTKLEELDAQLINLYNSDIKEITQ